MYINIYIILQNTNNLVLFYDMYTYGNILFESCGHIDNLEYGCYKLFDNV